MTLSDNPAGVPSALRGWRYNGTGQVLAVDGNPVAFVAAARMGRLSIDDMTDRIGLLVSGAPRLRDALVHIAREWEAGSVRAKSPDGFDVLRECRAALDAIGVVP